MLQEVFLVVAGAQTWNHLLLFLRQGMYLWWAKHGMLSKKHLFFNKTLEKVIIIFCLIATRRWKNQLTVFLAKFVSVGWGSKETQFHGSEGKDARSKKQVDCTLADWDDNGTRIVWRADGLFFAINAVEPNMGTAISFSIRVDIKLISKGEPCFETRASLN